jgi:RNA polymerase sigma factor (sigma-70 family)
MKLQEFTERILAVQPKLYRFALSLTGQTAEAEDVVQEVMLKIWNKREQRERFENLEAFCMQMTRNLALDKIKSKHKGHLTIEQLYGKASLEQSPQKLVETRDSLSQIEQLMEQLPLKQKMVLQLRDVEGLSYKEIAKILKIPLSQVKVYIFRARQFLKTELIAMHQYGLSKHQ